MRISLTRHAVWILLLTLVQSALPDESNAAVGAAAAGGGTTATTATTTTGIENKFLSDALQDLVETLRHPKLRITEPMLNTHLAIPQKWQGSEEHYALVEGLAKTATAEHYPKTLRQAFLYLQHQRHERPALNKFLQAINGSDNMREIWSDEDHCTWKGVTCNKEKLVIRLELPKMQLSGTLPRELQHLQHLKVLILVDNEIGGPMDVVAHIPVLHLDRNAFTGTLPMSIHAREWSLAQNYFVGTIPEMQKNLQFLDVSHNAMTGTVPPLGTNIQYLIVADNALHGIIPINSTTPSLEVLDVADNDFVNENSMRLPKTMTYVNLCNNGFNLTLQKTNFFSLPSIQSLMLSHNHFSGTLPSHFKTPHLGVLLLDSNALTGTIPTEFCALNALANVDISRNKITGTIPTQIGLLHSLHTIDAMHNRISGSLPNEMLQLNRNLRLNFTDNLITGTIPSTFCGEGATTLNILYRQFKCDAVLCRPGTFNVHGHATLYSACRKCPAYADSPMLGRIECPGLSYIHGDLDGDGVLSPREILRMLYIDTMGRFWGPAYQTWEDPTVNECDLLGITCASGKIARIDLSGAEMCSNGDRRPGPVSFCLGLPTEIGLLTTLEVLLLKRRQYLRGSLPTEIGQLSLLRYLDLSTCSSMTSTIPTEIGLLTNLKHLFMPHSYFHGAIPTEIYQLSNLEKLYLTNNRLEGSLSSLISGMSNMKELRISRNFLTGSFPTELSQLEKLENLEAYHNNLTGSLPSGGPSLKRIDVFSNKLSGSIPQSLGNVTSLQIFHVKDNQLSGTIPESLGRLPFLSWFDVSQNYISGTIPESFAAASAKLEDFRISGNRVYGTVPASLCRSRILNGGVQAGCAGVACAPGTYAEAGHTTADQACVPCPENQTTMYLASIKCETFTDQDMLTLLYEAFEGRKWPAIMQHGWTEPEKYSVCDYQGVHCDDQKKEIESIAIPVGKLT